jgi:excisionase family DNA binding protein
LRRSRSAGSRRVRAHLRPTTLDFDQAAWGSRRASRAVRPKTIPHTTRRLAPQLCRRLRRVRAGRRWVSIAATRRPWPPSSRPQLIFCTRVRFRRRRDEMIHAVPLEGERRTMMTVGEGAARWIVKPRTIYAMIADKKITALRVGRLVRVSRSHIEFLEYPFIVLRTPRMRRLEQRLEGWCDERCRPPAVAGLLVARPCAATTSAPAQARGAPASSATGRRGLASSPRARGCAVGSSPSDWNAAVSSTRDDMPNPDGSGTAFDRRALRARNANRRHARRAFVYTSAGNTASSMPTASRASAGSRRIQ